MTYEKFCTKVLSNAGESSKLSRKNVQWTAVRLIAIYVELSMALGYLVGCVVSSLSIISGIVVFMLLLFTTFPYISETAENYDRWSKISKLWWLFLILMIAAIVVMKLFLR